ncbi:PadR family transcriptional regulator [Kribbella sp. NPDC055071]
MNLTRLVVLGLLAERGPRHGHQLRRDVEITRADQWAAIGTGPMHRELRELAAAGFIEPVRTEQIGRRPQRTIYRITATGSAELDRLREQAIAPYRQPVDPVSVALVFAASGTDTLAALLAEHRQAVAAELERLAAERKRGHAEGFLDSPAQAASFRRAELHAEAELRWHDELGD